jgi:hypothetical protein
MGRPPGLRQWRKSAEPSPPSATYRYADRRCRYFVFHPTERRSLMHAEATRRQEKCETNSTLLESSARDFRIGPSAISSWLFVAALMGGSLCALGAFGSPWTGECFGSVARGRSPAATRELGGGSSLSDVPRSWHWWLSHFILRCSLGVAFMAPPRCSCWGRSFFRAACMPTPCRVPDFGEPLSPSEVRCSSLDGDSGVTRP